MPRDIFALKEYAFNADLRNRVIEAEDTPTVEPLPIRQGRTLVRGLDICIIPDCDSALVVGDGYRCRQCVLEGRY